MALEITNTQLDGEVTGENPDAGGDFYLVGDHNRDTHYNHGKIVEALKHISDSHETFQIIYGGEISDSGGGQINITAGVAIGKDALGNPKLIEIPAITNLSIPTGWNNNRQIWVTGQHKYITTGSTRNHDETSEAYHYIAIDSYKGVTPTDDLFVDADPTGNYVIWGSFKMNGTTFTNMYVRSKMFSSIKTIAGDLIGGIEFNTTALPPTIKAGTYEINGIPWQRTSDYNLAISDVLGSCSQTLSDYSYQWIFICIRASDGVPIWIMIEQQADLGVEVSGHFFFKALGGGDDGLFTGLLVAHILTGSGEALADLIQRIPWPVITPDLRIPLPEGAGYDLGRIEARCGGQVTRLDGVRAQCAEGWALARRSITEPVITLRFEGRDRQSLRHIAARFLAGAPGLHKLVQANLP